MFGIGDLGNQSVEGRFNFSGYRGVISLINQNARCGMRHIKAAEAILAI
jgi:hypothetical protein